MNAKCIGIELGQDVTILLLFPFVFPIVEFTGARKCKNVISVVC